MVRVVALRPGLGQPAGAAPGGAGGGPAAGPRPAGGSCARWCGWWPCGRASASRRELRQVVRGTAAGPRPAGGSCARWCGWWPCGRASASRRELRQVVQVVALHPSLGQPAGAAPGGAGGGPAARPRPAGGSCARWCRWWPCCPAAACRRELRQVVQVVALRPGLGQPAGAAPGGAGGGPAAGPRPAGGSCARWCRWWPCCPASAYARPTRRSFMRTCAASADTSNALAMAAKDFTFCR